MHTEKHTLKHIHIQRERDTHTHRYKYTGSYGRKRRQTKEPLDESERGE